jgi:hypothetical protein
LVTLGQPYCMLDLLETLRSEEDRPRTVSALVDAGGGQREQGDQREETDRQDGERGENFYQGESLLRCCQVCLHATGTYGVVTRPDPATVTVNC